MSQSVTNLLRQIYHLCHHGWFGWLAQKSSHIDFSLSVRSAGVQTLMTDCSLFVFSPFLPCHRLVAPKTYFGSWLNVDESLSVYFCWSEWGSEGFSALASEVIKPKKPFLWRFEISSGHCREGQIIKTWSVISVILLLQWHKIHLIHEVKAHKDD